MCYPVGLPEFGLDSQSSAAAGEHGTNPEPDTRKPGEVEQPGSASLEAGSRGNLTLFAWPVGSDKILRTKEAQSLLHGQCRGTLDDSNRLAKSRGRVKYGKAGRPGKPEVSPSILFIYRSLPHTLFAIAFSYLFLYRSMSVKAFLSECCCCCQVISSASSAASALDYIGYPKQRKCYASFSDPFFSIFLFPFSDPPVRLCQCP